jgi:hypothetical protein
LDHYQTVDFASEFVLLTDSEVWNSHFQWSLWIPMQNQRSENSLNQFFNWKGREPVRLKVSLWVSFWIKALVRIIKNLHTRQEARPFTFSGWTGGGVGCWTALFENRFLHCTNNKWIMYDFLLLWMKIRWEWAAYDDRWQIMGQKLWKWLRKYVILGGNQAVK